MKVLSLFDGMSCGQIALERAGIPRSDIQVLTAMYALYCLLSKLFYERVQSYSLPFYLSFKIGVCKFPVVLTRGGVVGFRSLN